MISGGIKSKVMIVVLLLFTFILGTISVVPIKKELNRTIQFLPPSSQAPINNIELLDLSNVGNRSFLSSFTNFNGSNVIVAILDTGIDVTHPDLDDLDDNNNTNDPKVIGGVSFAEGEPIYYGDLQGHGTYIAGIIAGTGNQSSDYVGIAPQARLLNVKVLSSYKQNGTFYTKASWIKSGIEWSINHGADIIVMAWSIPGTPTDEVNIAISEAVQRGLIVITAAGDDGPYFGTIGSPGMGPEGVTVGNFDNKTGSVAENSSKGPTFDFRAGIDVVASGMNITSTRARNTSFGIEVNENYSAISSSAAAAAYVAGVAAIFLQAFTFMNPWAFKSALMCTAIDLNLNPNEQGAGLLNETAAFLYLNSSLCDPLTENRTYSPSLPYAGFIGTENKSLYVKDFSSNCSFGDYGESIILTEYTSSSNFNASHLLGGIYAVQYNEGNITWFSDFEVLREMHYVTAGIYDRIVSVISDGNLMIIIVIEAWEWANISRSSPPFWQFGNLTSYRINFIFENIGTQAITNLNLFSWWKMDLFLNESKDYENDDSGQYDAADNIFYAYDTDNITGNPSFIGFKPNTTVLQMWYEVNSSNETYNFVNDDTIHNNSNSFGPGDVGFAIKWHLSNNIGVNQRTEFLGSIGIGKSLGDLKNRTSWILTNVTEFNNITDVCITDENYSLNRIINENGTIQSSIFVINVGTATLDHIKVRYQAISSSENVTRDFNLPLNIAPYDFESMTVSWTPSLGGFYNVTWFVLNATWLELRQVLKNPKFNETVNDWQLTDNFLQRNTLAYNSTYRNDFEPLLFSNDSLPYFPFMMNFSGDFAVFNLTILSSKVFSTLTTETKGNVSDWIDVEYETRSNYLGSNFISININTTFLTLPGFYLGNVSITLGSSQFLINVSFNLIFPKARILFDLSHTSFSSISDWSERTDSIHSAYFDFYRNITSKGYKIDELPINELTFGILQYYDCLIICDPESNFSSSEISDIQRYVADGSSLFMWVETPDECASSSINSLLNGTFDIEMGDTIYPNSSVVVNHTVPNQNFTSDVFTLEMVSPVNISISQSSTIAYSLTDYIASCQTQYNGRVIVIGDSQLFDNEHLYDQNNSQFAISCVGWLINESVKINYFNVTPVIKYLGDIICVTINLTAPNGTAIGTDIAYAAFILPNGTVFYMPMFHVRDGYHTTFLLSGYINQTGNFTVWVYVDHVSGVHLYANSTFNISGRAPAELERQLIFPITLDHNLSLFFIWSILGVIVIIWAISAINFWRKVKKVEIKKENEGKR